MTVNGFEYFKEWLSPASEGAGGEQCTRARDRDSEPLVPRSSRKAHWVESTLRIAGRIVAGWDVVIHSTPVPNTNVLCHHIPLVVPLDQGATVLT